MLSFPSLLKPSTLILFIVFAAVVSFTAIPENLNGNSPLFYMLRTFVLLTLAFGCLIYVMKTENVFELKNEGLLHGRLPLISWSDIEDVNLVSMMGQPSVGIILKNKDAYFFKLTSRQRENALMMNSLTGAPIVLNPDISKMQNDDLINKINHYKNLYGAK